MWESFSNWMSAAEPVDILISLISSVFIFATWWTVTVGRWRRERRVFRELKSNSGTRPAILILDLNPNKDIELDVERFRQTQPDLAAIPKERIRKISRIRDLKSEDMIGLVQDIRQAKADFARHSVDLIHFFYGGPIIVPTLVGAEFVNGCMVLLYQHLPGRGTYENWGPLRHDNVG